MRLNLKRKIGINENTPLDVISYFLNTMSMQVETSEIEKKMKKIIKFSNEYENYIEIKDEMSPEDYEKISTYLSNTNELWTVDNLMKSLRDLLNFEKNLRLENIRIGVRTDKEPYKTDIIMIYKLCQTAGVETNRGDTIETLFQKFKDLNLDRKKMIVDIKNNLLDFSDYELIKINSFSEEKTEKKKIEIDEIKEISENININYMINKILLTDTEAIVYASKFFSMDITDSMFPKKVLNKLSCDDYDFDFDDVFSKNYKINSDFYRMDKFWRKNISFLYSPKVIANLKKYESISNDDQKDFSELDNKLKENNFYFGRIPEIHSLDDEKDIISYGVYSEKNLEKINLINIYNEFNTNISFGKYTTNINKLLLISKEKDGHIYQKIFDIIIYIKKFGSVFDDNVRKMINSSEEEKTKFTEIFEKLYEISLLFKTEETLNDLDNLSILNSIEQLVKKINEEEIIKNLSLVNYKNERFLKANENYYTNFYDDIKSLKNLQEKSKEFIKTKYCYYKNTSYYYYYVVTRKELFNLSE